MSHESSGILTCVYAIINERSFESFMCLARVQIRLHVVHADRIKGPSVDFFNFFFN